MTRLDRKINRPENIAAAKAMFLAARLCLYMGWDRSKFERAVLLVWDTTIEADRLLDEQSQRAP